MGRHGECLTGHFVYCVGQAVFVEDLPDHEKAKVLSKVGAIDSFLARQNVTCALSMAVLGRFR